jgi:Fe-S cluster assembly scaffold protein SufB
MAVREYRIETSGRVMRRLWRCGDETLRIRLLNEGAEVELFGAFVVCAENALSLRIEVLHEAPKTKSRIVLRGLVAEQGIARVHEIATIRKGAAGAETHVEAKAILLSEQAKAELEPYLEIEEDEVRATHSASVRPLEEEEIFYLTTRGLSRAAAQRLLIEAFFRPVAHALKNVRGAW